MNNSNEIIQSLITELKRGTLTISVLSQLQTPQYGYSLLKKLEDHDILIEAGTLYPLLRRLEKQELLSSEWDTSESRPRKYYQLSETGKVVFQEIKTIWQQMSEKINEAVKEGE